MNRVRACRTGAEIAATTTVGTVLRLAALAYVSLPTLTCVNAGTRNLPSWRHAAYAACLSLWRLTQVKAWKHDRGRVAQDSISIVESTEEQRVEGCFTVECDAMSNWKSKLLKILRGVRISSEKRLSTSSCRPACISAAPILRIIVKFYIWISNNFCRENPNLIKIVQQYRPLNLNT